MIKNNFGVLKKFADIFYKKESGRMERVYIFIKAELILVLIFMSVNILTVSFSPDFMQSLFANLPLIDLLPSPFPSYLHAGIFIIAGVIMLFLFLETRRTILLFRKWEENYTRYRKYLE